MASGEELYNYTSDDLEKFMEVALKLAKEAGKMVFAGLGKQKEVDHKDEDCKEGFASSVLTETDTAVEKHLVAGLRENFPDHCFIGEEAISASASGMVDTYSNKPTWIIDPIDGTMNFVHSNPLVVTSMGLAINRKMVVGIVYSPISGHTYTAIKGKGAFWNGRGPLKTSGVKDLKKAMTILELPAGANENKLSVTLKNVEFLLRNAHAVRSPGPAALDIAWVGAGQADGFTHHTLHCWDMAAGALIVEEAGGCVLSADGSEFDLMGRTIVCAASQELAEKLVANLKVYDVSQRDFMERCPI